MNNISPNIEAKRKRKLHNQEDHPVCMLKKKIQAYFHDFEIYDDLSEVVTIQQNFDELLIPTDHPARKASDTYYVDEAHVLRTHTSAHQSELLKKGIKQFLATGDVYRKDTIDKTHYPVFHQMEGVKIVQEGDALADLVNTLEGLIKYLYPGSEYRILDDYFPFTHPSIQFEVKQGNEWMEVLGAGVIQPQILGNCGVKGSGWAFGLGIDRLLLKMCAIPDIRYLWSSDSRFLDQFRNGLMQFEAYSKYPPVYKDISFWVKDYQENPLEKIWEKYYDLCDLIRDLANDFIESIEFLDKFQKNGQVSLAYRICYRSYDRTLTNEEINEIQWKVRGKVTEKFEVELR